MHKLILKSDSTLPLPAELEVEKISGWLSAEELARRIRDADFYLAPRLQEGIGFSFLEAMALGKPILGHNDATMNEYVIEGETGHLFDRSGRLFNELKSPSELCQNVASCSKKNYLQWLRDRQRLQSYLLSGVR